MTAYAKAGDVSIAYQVFGSGERDLVLVQGYATHVDLDWENADFVRFAEGLGAFSRVLHFDKRGTGLSDRVSAMPTLEERMDDIRAVMDAAGSEKAVLFGVSEGAPLSILFAATYPERTEALVIHGGMARSTWAPDYPWANTREGLIEAAAEALVPYIYSGEDVEIWMPSYADNAAYMEGLGRYRRAAVSPAGLQMFFEMFLDVDVRSVLPAVQAPTLVTHRRGDRVVNRRAGEYLAAQIRGARYVEFPGADHFPWAPDGAAILAAIREFLTGDRGPDEIADRVLATVLFTDIVGSTEHASASGDSVWRDLLERHDRIVDAEIERFRGRRVKSLGDGVLATFDGPGRAIRCSRAIMSALTPLGLRIRAGVHCGEVEVRGDDIAGIAVHIAARVAGIADGGEVLVSAPVVGLVAGSGLTFDTRGTHAFKGMTGDIEVFAAV